MRGMLSRLCGAAVVIMAAFSSATGQTVLVNENFDGYASDTDMRAVWVPTVGNGSLPANFVDETSGILTNDATLFPGIEGQAVDHIGATASSPGMVNQYGGVIDQFNGLQPAFQAIPSATQSVFVSVDVFESGNGNERMTLGMRYIDTSGGSVLTQNILELGVYNAASTDVTGGADPNFFAGTGLGYRAILFGGFDESLTGQPNWQYFQLPAELDRPTDVDEVTNIGDIGGGWHRYTALVEPEQITLSIDLWRDGLRNTSRTPDTETGIRPGDPGVDATITWPVSVTANGFNSLRFGGPSGLTSPGTGATAFDNVLLQMVDAAAPTNDIVIDVASGVQTQAEAGYATIATADSVTKTGAGTLVFDAANAYTGPTTVSAGTLLVSNGSAVASSAVTVATGGTLALPTDGRVSVSAAGLSVDQAPGGGLVDLGPGQLVVAAGGISAADLRADIIAGRNGGGWNGTAGITSSAAATAGGARAVGYVIAGDGTATVSFAAPGDTDLNGAVNVFDLVTVNSSGKYGTGSAAVWSQGDSNYDGVTNVFDLVGINGSGAYGQGNYFPAAPSVGSVAAVPEPGFLGAGAAAILAGMLAVRRRRPAA
jgi:autotransporter-associated beta strand protein